MGGSQAAPRLDPAAKAAGASKSNSACSDFSGKVSMSNSRTSAGGAHLVGAHVVEEITGKCSDDGFSQGSSKQNL